MRYWLNISLVGSILLHLACMEGSFSGGASPEEEKKTEVRESVAAAIAELGEEAGFSEIAAACAPAVPIKAIESGTPLSQICGEAYLVLGREAVNDGDDQKASSLLSQARSVGVRSPSGDDLKEAVREATRKRRALESAIAYIQRINRELDGLSRFDTSKYTESRDSIVIGVALFSAWAQIAQEAKQHELTREQASKVARFKLRVAQIQTRALPRFRDAFGPALRKALWEHDLEAKTTGRSYSTIQFTGRIFAINRNIKEFHSGVREVLYQLRFRQARYRWYRGASQYTYYDLDSPPDSALIIWSGDSRFVEVD